ncbi:hypothetical protein GJQ54_06390 [Oceanospirillaceae bacterium ASx5O]|nr:hypothetical protein GJQ54_06390 [Oceanospirillaceae bacterium ASx5O]
MKNLLHPLLLLLTLSIQPALAIPTLWHSVGIQPDVRWQTNSNSPTWAAAADPGGYLNLYLPEFPPHLRRFGPDTPHTSSPILESLHLPLLARHPRDQSWLPMLASHWATDERHRILYLQINPAARWSDGQPVTNRDIAFTLSFLTDPAHGADWQRQRLQQRIQRAEFFNDHQVALHLHPPFQQAVEEIAALRPLAAHFYAQQQWPQDVNWQPEPVTGPYRLSRIKHAHSLVFERLKNWWGTSERYFQGRFNVTRVTLLSVPDTAKLLEHLQRAELDLLPVSHDLLQQPGLQSLHQQQRLVLTEQHQQHSAISRILLLNPAFSADKQQRLRLLNGAAPATEYPPLLTHTPGQPAGLPAAIHTQQLNAEVLLQRIRSSRFSLAELRFLRPLSPAQLEAQLADWLQEWPGDIHLPALQQQGLLHISQTPAVRYTLHWPWLQLPENPLLPWLGDLFDPFDAVSGGLFSIDRKQRTEVLANPQRRTRETPTRHILAPETTVSGLSLPIQPSKD